MSELVLTSKEFRKMPYNTTKVSVKETQIAIANLLKEYGVENKAWITEHGKETLIFQITVQVGNVERTLAFKFQPVMIRVNYPRKRKKLEEKASWRIFYWYLKSKLEAIKYGLISIERELMANIIYSGQLQDARTIGDVMTEIIQTGKLNRLNRVALEDKTIPKSIIADYKEIK